MTNPLKAILRFDRWYDNLGDDRRFGFFFFVVALPFSVSIAFPEYMISKIIIVTVCSWTALRIYLMHFSRRRKRQ